MENKTLTPATADDARRYGEANRIEGGDGWQLMADFANAFAAGRLDADGSSDVLFRPLSVDEMRSMYQGDLCVCGRSKIRHRPLCGDDIEALSVRTRQKVRSYGFGGGLEEAIGEALTELGIGPPEIDGWREALAVRRSGTRGDGYVR